MKFINTLKIYINYLSLHLSWVGYSLIHKKDALCRMNKEITINKKQGQTQTTKIHVTLIQDHERIGQGYLLQP